MGLIKRGSSDRGIRERNTKLYSTRDKNKGWPKISEVEGCGSRMFRNKPDAAHGEGGEEGRQGTMTVRRGGRDTN